MKRYLMIEHPFISLYNEDLAFYCVDLVDLAARTIQIKQTE